MVVDDDELTARAMRDGLVRAGIAAEACFAANDALDRLERGGFDLVLVDVQLPGASGLDVCAEITRRWPSVDVMVMSAHGSTDRAVAAVRAGAHDFVTKPISSESLVQRVQRLASNRARATGRPAGLPGRRPRSQVELVGASAAMQRARELVSRFASSTANVLVTGESGTGKEIVARRLHLESARRDGPFVALNCAALPDALLESELFGHVRGAFTDARADRAGLFAQASGGTIFLDEVGELPLALQPKLLRALEDGLIRPIGGGAELPIDVRVVAATHRDLAADAAAGRFRRDLFYRLHVLRLALPPLRERADDLELLARRFVGEVAAAEGKDVRGLSADAMARLRAHPWPGNVRELRNCLAHAIALARGPWIEVDDLPDHLRASTAAALPAAWSTLAERERVYIDEVLAHVGGNRSAAARVLGVDRRTLMRKLAARR
jgi:DNA-binding NtrC family response regulator